MKKIDILREIAELNISESEADAILDVIMDSPQPEPIERFLGFSRTEWTAYAHGATLGELARWRKGGWPTECVVCGENIDVEKFGWRVIDNDGVSRLKHVLCKIV